MAAKSKPARAPALRQAELVGAIASRRARTRRSRRVEPAAALGTALTIAEVRACWHALRALLDRGQAELDARALEAIDTAGLQLLLAGGRAARARGLKLRLIGAERLLLGAAAALGLDAPLLEVVELAP